MRKFITVFALLAIAITFSACTNEGAEAKPASLNGTWKADGFQAQIAENSIEVNIVGDETSSLYWKGTFPSGKDIVKSVADKEALESSLLGSQDSEKVFTVTNDEIVFKITMLGTSMMVHLQKQ